MKSMQHKLQCLWPVYSTELLTVWTWSGLLSNVWRYPECALLNISSFTYETVDFRNSVINLLSNLLKFTNKFSLKLGAICPYVSCALTMTSFLHNFYCDSNVTFTHMALSGRAQHCRYTLHFIIGDYNLNFCCTFCTNSVISSHIKIGLLLFSIVLSLPLPSNI